MKALRPSAKKANQVRTTAFRTIDNQLSKKRCVGQPRKAQQEQRADRNDKGQEELGQRDDEQRDAQEDDRSRTRRSAAASSRSSRNMLASFMMSGDLDARVVVELVEQCIGRRDRVEGSTPVEYVLATPIASAFAGVGDIGDVEG